MFKILAIMNQVFAAEIYAHFLAPLLTLHLKLRFLFCLLLHLV